MAQTGSIYSKPVLFTIAATVAVLVGSVVMMAYPMVRADMHPRLEKLRPYGPLQLAGRDVYQREGCMNCHTQMVRPLKAEVARYGEYSKAGEFTYDHPFLWGSKRTGPDLARVGGKYPDAWHAKHLENPQAFAARSNMPSYAFLAKARLDPKEVEAHLRGLAALHPGEVKWSADEIHSLADKTEMDALVAYMQFLGSAVERPRKGGDLGDVPLANPLAGDAAAIAKGKQLYADRCAQCHGDALEGGIGPALADREFLYAPGDVADGSYFRLIASGSEVGELEGRKPHGDMPAFASELGKEDIWSVVAFIRSAQK